MFGAEILRAVDGIIIDSETAPLTGPNAKTTADREIAKLEALRDGEIFFTSRKEARMEAEEIVRALGAIIATNPNAGVREMALQLMGRVIEREMEEEAEDDDAPPRAEWARMELLHPRIAREGVIDEQMILAGVEMIEPRGKGERVPLVEFLEHRGRADSSPAVRAAAVGLALRLEKGPSRNVEPLFREPELALAAVNEN